MSEQSKGPSSEDVSALAAEMQELKEVVREVAGKLGRIEKRLRVFFPDSFPNTGTRRKAAADSFDKPPTMTPREALELYDKLVTQARSGSEREVEAAISRLELPDLALLVRELGAPAGKKPTRKALTKSLMGRLKESIMLSRHTPRPKTEGISRQSGQSPSHEQKKETEAVAPNDKPGDGT